MRDVFFVSDKYFGLQCHTEHIVTHGQAGRQAGRQADRQAGRQTGS